MYNVNCETELSNKAKYELGNIVFAGILKEIERGELPKEVLQEMVEFYKEACLLGANHLIEKLNQIK